MPKGSYRGPQTMEEIDERVELMARNLFYIVNPSQKVGYFNPYSELFESTKDGYRNIANKILSLDCIQIKAEDQSLPEKPARWQKESMDYHAGYYKAEEQILSDDWMRVEKK